MSQDHFLNKTYESMLTGTTTPKLVVEKKQVPAASTLSQAYYKVYLKQINEESTVLMQNQPDGEVEEYTVSDDTARKIKSEIKKETTFATKNGEKFSIVQIIETVLQSKNWSKVGQEYKNLLHNVVNAFSTEDIVTDNFANYITLSRTKDNPFRTKILNAPKTPHNFTDIIPDWFNKFFTTGNGEKVANILWDIAINAKPAIGRGELAISLISDAVKGETGDLYLADNEEGGHIEMKGKAGTVGGDGYVISTHKELNRILNGGDILSVSEENRKKLMIQRLSTLIPSVHRDFRDRLIQSIQQGMRVEELEALVRQSQLTPNNKEKLNKTLARGLVMPKFNFKDALLTFFGTYETLSDDELASGVLACRNYKNISSPDVLKNKIKEIISQNKSNLFNEQLLSRKCPYTLATLLGALHICCYQEREGFKGILFVNDTNKKMIYCNFVGNTAAENLQDVFNFLNQFKPTMSLTMSSLQKSIGFSFFN